MSNQPGSRPPLEGDAALIRAVGSFALAAAVMNIIVGGGIFRMPSALSAQVGIAAPLALVAGAMAIIPVALCFAAIGSRAIVTGGPYSYLRATFGNFAGFVAGALMWISNVASSAGVAAAFAVQMANLLPWFAQPLPRAGLLTALYPLLYALNAFGVKLGARAITLLAGLKLTPLFLLVAIGLFFVDWTQVSFSPREVPSWAALGTGMVLVMFAYSGMETALVPSGEVRDPSRSVPRATMIAILLVVLLYLGLQVVSQGLLGPALGSSGVPLADTAGALWSVGRTVLLVTACISMAGFLLGNLLGSSRLLFALGRDGYLPHVFGRVSARHRVPLLALATHAGLAWLLALGGTFDTLALISGGAICLVYALVSVSAWRGQRSNLRERGDTPFVLWGGPLVPLIGFGAMALIVTTLSSKEWLAIGVALAALVLVYLLVRTLKRDNASSL